MTPKYIVREPAEDERILARDSFAKSLCLPWFGAQLFPDIRNPTTPVASEKVRARMLALAELVSEVTQLHVVASLDGGTRALILDTPERPVWTYVIFSFRGAEFGVEAKVKEFLQQRHGHKADRLVFQR